MKTVEELNELAKTYEDIILTNGLTKAEIIMLLALVDARVKSRLVAVGPVVAAPVTEKKETRIEGPLKRKGIQYDPLYDPAPPFEVESPPTPPTSGGILATKGHACICNSCGRVVYRVNKDISDGCKIPDFIASFTPMDDSCPPLDRSAEIMNIDGQISTDCPLCKGSKTLYLTGKKGISV